MSKFKVPERPWPSDGLVTAHFALRLDQPLMYLRACTFVKSDVKSVAAGKVGDAQTNLSSTQDRNNPQLNNSYVFRSADGLYR